MISAIGLIEFTAIAKGIESTDAMLKAGDVELSFAKPVCPGKFITLVHGPVGAVKAATTAGVEVGGTRVVNHLVIPRVHPTLIPAINAVSDIAGLESVGVVEYFDIASAVVGADAAAKRGSIHLIEVRLGVGIGGKSFVTLSGQVSDVRAAVAAAIEAGQTGGQVVSSCVLPSPDPALFRSLL